MKLKDPGLVHRYPIMRHFEYEGVTRTKVELFICHTAEQVANTIPDSEQKQLGLIKLLEAMDCFKRAQT